MNKLNEKKKKTRNQCYIILKLGKLISKFFLNNLGVETCFFKLFSHSYTPLRGARW